MLYRRLTEDHDMSFGRGKQDFLEDSLGNPEAIAQAIKTRLLLFLGEWWMDTLDGLPLWQKILGQRVVDKGIIDRILIDRIRAFVMPDNRFGIISIYDVSGEFNPEDRSYSFSCMVDTIYGKLRITNADHQGGV